MLKSKHYPRDGFFIPFQKMTFLEVVEENKHTAKIKVNFKWGSMTVSGSVAKKILEDYENYYECW